MAARAIGSKAGNVNNQLPSAGVGGGSQAAEPSIFDLGSVLVGDERTVDFSVTGDASDDSGGSASFTDPTTIPGADGDAPYGYLPDGVTPRRRRAKGSGSAPRAASSSGSSRPGKQSKEEIQKTLTFGIMSIHMMLAKLTKIEEIELTDEESEKLSEAAIRLTTLYGVGVVDEKTIAWANLVIAMGSVYGPRVGAVLLNKKKSQPGPQRMNMGAVPFPASQVV